MEQQVDGEATDYYFSDFPDILSEVKQEFIITSPFPC